MSNFLQVAKYYWDKELGEIPRDLGIRRYPKVESDKDYYIYLLDRTLDHQDAFISFYSDKEIRDGQVNKIFLDVDSKVGSEVIWNGMQLFAKTFWESIEVYYSGKKGFHTILYIEPTSFDDMLKQRSRLYDVFSTWLQFPVDRFTFLNLRQLVRIPFTLHPQTQRFKIPVHHSWQFPDIMEYSTYPMRYADKFVPLTSKSIIPTKWDWFTINPKDFFTIN
jgi:hypothetical protein